jgi:integrase
MVLSPLARMPAVKLGHIPAYTEAQAQRAMTAWPEHLRRAAVLAYWIGQRRGDLTALRWDAYDLTTGVIRVQPEKTRKRREAKGLGPLIIPVPLPLAVELARWRRAAPQATHVLTSSTGRPWSKGGLINAIYWQLKEEGWDTKAGLHGMRKRSAQVLAEAGASASEIGAARGWDTLAMVQLYTAGADQEKLARAGVARLSKPLAKTVKNRR